MRNRYAGKCSCGSFVDEGEGTVNKVGGAWKITCDACAPVDRVCFEVVRILVDGPLGDEVHDPVPVLYPTIDEARAMARRIYAGGCGFTEADLENLLLCEIRKIELRGARSAFPAGFVECVAREG